MSETTAPAAQARPRLAIDLYCGLGGWTTGLLAAGFRVLGFDIEDHRYGDHRYPAQMILQDVRTLHGSQFRDATLLVASPPCQKYSYLALPWTRAKALARWYRDPSHPERLVELNELFEACFRIQREASEAANRHVPMVVENVRGAQPWVGKADWHHESYYLWGDLPALMPIPTRQSGVKVPGWRFDGSGRSCQTAATDRKKGDGWFGAGNKKDQMRKHLGGRKSFSAMISRIPFQLAAHIGSVYARDQG